MIVSIFKPAFIDILYSTLITVAFKAAAFKKTDVWNRGCDRMRKIWMSNLLT